MAWRGKDATIILVDVGRTMCCGMASADASKVTKATSALKVARKFVQQKLLFMPKHEVGIVFLGTVDTCNDLQHDGYPNIIVAREGRLEPPDLDMLRLLSAVPPGGAESDAVNGLIVAIDWLNKRTRMAKYTSKTVHLFTDGNSVAPGDPDMQECVKQLETNGGRLLVTPVGAPDGNVWAQLADSSPQVELVPISVVAHRCSKAVKPVELRAKVRLNLQVSPDLSIPVGVYSRTTRVSFPTLKRRSKPAAVVPEEHRKTDAVVVERTYHVADDPDGEEIKQEDRIKGHRYGSSIVPMSEYDEAALMYTCERTLCALGFAPLASVGPEHSMGQVEVVAADRGDAWAFYAFESMIGAMISEGTALIGRYCSRQNSQPRMVALIPRQGVAPLASTMEMQYLPFFEDIREWTCASLVAPSLEQRNAATALVDAMMLESAEDPSRDLYRPEDTHNPALTRFYNFLVQRAMKPGAPVPPPGPECSCERPAVVEALLEKSQAAEQLKAKFGLEKVEKAQAKKRRFWREAIAEKQKDANFGEVDTKKIKVQVKEGEKKEEEEEDDKVKLEGVADGGVGVGGGAASSSSGAGPGLAAPVGVPPRVHIGTVHPERDFERWLAERRGGIDTVSEAVRQMCVIVDRTAEEGEDYHAKALSCLTALRRGCVQEGEAVAFNDFVRGLSTATSQRRSRFWQRAREAGLGLIMDSEVATSTVTAEEARAFLAGEPFAASSSRAGASASGAGAGDLEAAGALSERDLEAMLE